MWFQYFQNYVLLHFFSVTYVILFVRHFYKNILIIIVNDCHCDLSILRFDTIVAKITPTLHVVKCSMMLTNVKVGKGV